MQRHVYVDTLNRAHGSELRVVVKTGATSIESLSQGDYRIHAQAVRLREMDKQWRTNELWRELHAPDRFIHKRQSIRQFVDRENQVTPHKYKGVADTDHGWTAGIVEYPSDSGQTYRCVLVVLDISSRHGHSY